MLPCDSPTGSSHERCYLKVQLFKGMFPVWLKTMTNALRCRQILIAAQNMLTAAEKANSYQIFAYYY